MKISLASILLLVLLVASLCGWFVDHRKLVEDQLELQHELQTLSWGSDFPIYHGAENWGLADGKLDILEMLVKGGGDARLIQRQGVQILIDLFREYKDMEFAAKRCIAPTLDVRLLSCRAIRVLQCNSASEFYQIADQFSLVEDFEPLPELNRVDGGEAFNGFAIFLSDSIAVVNEKHRLSKGYDDDPRKEW